MLVTNPVLIGHKGISGIPHHPRQLATGLSRVEEIGIGKAFFFKTAPPISFP